MMTLPESVKKRRTREPTIMCLSVGGTSQGLHFTDIDIDDPVGEQDLSAGRMSNVDMVKKSNWLLDIDRSLIMDPKTTRIRAKFTRYSPDDAYEVPIFQNMKEYILYDEDKRDYDVKPDGRWTVYHRFVKENNKIVFPEKVTEEWLEDLRRKNPWFYWTQMENRPLKSEMNELGDYDVIPFEVKEDEDRGYYFDLKDEKIYMEFCDVVQAADPAGTDTNITAKTSKTAVGILAHTPDDRRFLFGIQAGFWKPTKLYDVLFANMSRYQGYLRNTLLEAQGPFKILVSLIRDEERKRGKLLYLRPVQAVGKKEIRIRNALDPVLKDNLLYVEKGQSLDLFENEFKRFPGSGKDDVLDMATIALNGTFRPFSEEEEDERLLQYDKFYSREVNAVGY
jgi:hypothetical protein